MYHSEYIRRTDGNRSAVVMIHGIVGTPRYFDGFISSIPSDCDIYNILLDGHGKTVRDFSHTSMKKWISQVDNLLSALTARYESIVLMGHSMGTLLALNASLKYANKIQTLVLFAVPLKLSLKPSAGINALRVIFKCIDVNDPVQSAAEKAFGIEPDPHLWRYIGWMPRYLELFSLIRRTRKIIPQITVNSYTFQSEQDEMVSKKAIKYLSLNPLFKNEFLKKSRHYYFSPEDLQYLENRIEEIFTKL